MNIFVCVDVNGGMLFNNRRQSRDKKVIEKMMEIKMEERLWISQFSEKLFEGYSVFSDEMMFDKAEEKDFCFVEKLNFINYIEQISKIYIFRWDRNYPFDIGFPSEILDKYNLILEEKFEGNSHEKVTLEVYSNGE